MKQSKESLMVLRPEGMVQLMSLQLLFIGIATEIKQTVKRTEMP